jgi:23S rRNA pseudouridine2605 synthase
LSQAGIASRRKADELIAAGEIRVNGETVRDLGIKINPRKDLVYYHEKQVAIVDESPEYIVFNKPKDCITTLSDEKSRTTVLDYVKTKNRVYPIGRLDRNTTGVLLLTNDGDLAHRLMHPRYEFPKAYQVDIDHALTDSDARKLAAGIRLEDGVTSPAEVIILPHSNRKSVGIVVHEGRNRMVRRMFENLGYEIIRLDRIGYGEITTAGLQRGEWRHLTRNEIEKLRRMVETKSEKKVKTIDDF